MPSEYILDVTESDFELEVLAHSQKVPVVVDFWAEWCGPCRILGPILERLAEEAEGAFRLAKVDVDENPRLAMQYNVRGIPMVKAFRNGQVVADFVGAQPEPLVRQFIRTVVPSPMDLNLEKADSLVKGQDWLAAEEVYRQVLANEPQNPVALLGLAKCLLARGEIKESEHILKAFPASKEYNAAEKLRPLVNALLWAQQFNGTSEDILDAAYARAIDLTLRQNYPAAMDGLLEILRKDKRYRNDEARKMMLALFELLGAETPLCREYQSELASVLF